MHGVGRIPSPSDCQEALFDHANPFPNRHRAAHGRLLRARRDNEYLTEICDSFDRGVQAGRIYAIVVGHKYKRRHNSHNILLKLFPQCPIASTHLF
jgi:hypothetical protein